MFETDERTEKFGYTATHLIGRTRGRFSFDPVPVGDVSSVNIQLLGEFKSFFRAWSFG